MDAIISSSSFAAIGLKTEKIALLRPCSHISIKKCRNLPQRPQLVSLRAKADEKKTETAVNDEMVDLHINPYCDITKGKKSIGELEQDFLQALQSFYIDGVPTMSNEEFDNLKEELTWEGSSVVVLSADEQKFMEASLAYLAGKPFLSDAEFDNLKLNLKKQGSKLAIAGPRCSIRSKKVFSDSSVDYLRMTLLNVPAALVALSVVFLLDDITGFEITYLLELPEPYSFLFTWFIVLPAVYLLASTITNLILRDFIILKGPCPNCGANNLSFFGSILGISSEGGVNDVKCESCGAKIRFNYETRQISLEAEPAPKKPAKKKAGAASKA